MTDAPARFRKRPVVIEALQWTGKNYFAMKAFTEDNFLVSARSGVPYAYEVYDKLHMTWIKFSIGDWIIKGIKGEFYPCEADAFAKTYEPMTDETPTRYVAGDLIIEETTKEGGRLFLVLAVGQESYFVRRLDGVSDVEPLETAWSIEGCEAHTHLHERPKEEN